MPRGVAEESDDQFERELERESFRIAGAAAYAPGRWSRLSIRIILIGALNFVLYTAMYAAIGGDAHNGERRVTSTPDGGRKVEYFVRGHFIRTPDGQARTVSRGVWIYSYLHSISVFITSAAMILSMLVLARPHIRATMRDSRISGDTFVVSLGTIVLLIASGAVILFTWDFVSQLSA